jgi:hypothetical protein
MAFAVYGAPLSLRQVVQWHRPILMGGPLASIRMAPQLQLAVRVSGMITPRVALAGNMASSR